jgi:hypothetical protein
VGIIACGVDCGGGAASGDGVDAPGVGAVNDGVGGADRPAAPPAGGATDGTDVPDGSADGDAVPPAVGVVVPPAGAPTDVPGVVWTGTLVDGPLVWPVESTPTTPGAGVVRPGAAEVTPGATGVVSPGVTGDGAAEDDNDGDVAVVDGAMVPGPIPVAAGGVPTSGVEPGVPSTVLDPGTAGPADDGETTGGAIPEGVGVGGVGTACATEVPAVGAGWAAARSAGGA